MSAHRTPIRPGPLSPDQPFDHRQGWVLAALLGAMFLGNVDVAVTNTATPAIRADLGASGGQLELVVSGYTLAYASSLVTAARLGRERGYRRMYLLGLVGFTVASVACGLAPDPWTLVIMRIVQGAAASLMISQVLTGIQLQFTGAARQRALGWYAAVLAGSAVVGQLLGGVIVSADLFGTGWRPVFMINLPLGLLVWVLSLLVLPPDRALERDKADPLGVALLSAGLLATVVPLVFGHEQGWPPWTWITLGLGVSLLVLFVVQQARARRAGRRSLIDTGLFRRPVIGWGLVSATLSTSTYFAILFVLALYLQDGLGRSAAFSGSALIGWVAAFGVTGPVLGRFGARGRRCAAAIGGLVLGTAFAAISATLLAGWHSSVVLIALLTLGGLGFGAMFAGTLTQLTASVSVEHASDVSGLFNTCTRVGGMVGVAVFGAVYFAGLGGQGLDAARGFRLSCAAMAATALVAAGCAVLAARRVGPSGNSR